MRRLKSFLYAFVVCLLSAIQSYGENILQELAIRKPHVQNEDIHNIDFGYFSLLTELYHV